MGFLLHYSKIHTYTHTHTCMHTHTRTYTDTYVHAQISTWVHSTYDTHIHTHTWRADDHTTAHSCMHACIFTYVVYIHPHIWEVSASHDKHPSLREKQNRASYSKIVISHYISYLHSSMEWAMRYSRAPKVLFCCFLCLVRLPSS